VLHNLLGNAVKFSRDGATVQIGVERCGDTVALKVCDTGIGMRAEDIPRALEPFQQIDSTLARSFGGAGLGLPIAMGLAEAHGATLTIDSVPDEGTTVIVSLPRERVRIAEPG
jgi:signal transduction histidine kinase